MINNQKCDQESPFFCHYLLVLGQDVYQLYAHGNDFLLILIYQANCTQKSEGIHVHLLIEKVANKTIVLKDMEHIIS